MTMPDERLRAVVQTRRFLEELCDPSRAPDIPADARREAHRLLRHYPQDAVLDLATLALPRWFAWPDASHCGGSDGADKQAP